MIWWTVLMRAVMDKVERFFQISFLFRNWGTKHVLHEVMLTSTL